MNDKYILPIYGDVKPDFYPGVEPHPFEGFHGGEIELDGETIRMNLHLDVNAVNDNALDFARKAIRNIEKYAKISYLGIEYDFKNGTEVKEYLDLHIAGLEKIDIEEIIIDGDKSKSLEEQLFSTIALNGIGICPHENGNYIFFDYRLGEELIHHILVISVAENGPILYIGTES